MERDQFIHTVTLMKDDLIAKLLFLLPFLRRHRCDTDALARRLAALVGSLDGVARGASALPAGRRCLLPSPVCAEYEAAAEEAGRHLADAALRLLVRLGILEEVRVVARAEEAAAAGCCGICLEGYTAGEAAAALTCSHRFHGRCIVAWFRRELTCPFCRRYPGEASTPGGAPA